MHQVDEIAEQCCFHNLPIFDPVEFRVSQHGDFVVGWNAKEWCMPSQCHSAAVCSVGTVSHNFETICVGQVCCVNAVNAVAYFQFQSKTGME